MRGQRAGRGTGEHGGGGVKGINELRPRLPHGFRRPPSAMRASGAVRSTDEFPASSSLVGWGCELQDSTGCCVHPGQRSLLCQGANQLAPLGPRAQALV